MSKTTIETTITRAYLRNRTKDDIIEHDMRLLRENDDLQKTVENLKGRIDETISILHQNKIWEDCAVEALEFLEGCK